ncbi:MAG: hypothetical protein IKC63_00370 [Clostridia bacterium]|nr:hypothetical protein [Clostridia bacterium]
MKRLRYLLPLLLILLLSASLFVFAADPDKTTAAGDMTFYAVNCVDEAKTDPASAIMQQGYNGQNFSRFDATAVGESITYSLNVPKAGEYKITLAVRVHDSCGYADLYINGEKYGEIDNATGTANAMKNISLGKINLKAGENEFRFVITKPNPKPAGERKYYLNIMSFELKVPKTIEELGLPTVALPESVSTAVYNSTSTDKVTVYPFPSKYTRSTTFAVTADGLDVPVRNFMNGSYDDYDYAEFTMKKGPVTVTVHVPHAITSYEISPRSAGIEAKVNGKSLTFTLEKDEYLILKINNYKELVLTVDPPETDVPASQGEGIFNVITANYRADNTGNAISTGSLQKAIDDASAWGTLHKKQGVVYVPAGVYKIGTIALKSNVALYLEGGAVLYATGSAEDYIQRAFKNSIGKPVTQMIYVYNNKVYDPYEEEYNNPENYVNAENIKIYGRGTVDARGREMENEGFLMQTLVAYNCKNFVSDGISYVDTNIWSIIPGCSEDMLFKNLKVLNMLGLHENDCIDVNNCKNVVISNAIGIALDDPFTTKTYLGGSEMFRSLIDTGVGCENVLFEDCLSWTICYGYKLGQGANYDHTNITFRNSTVYNCSVGLGINHKYGGGSISGVVFDNIVIEHCTWTNGSWQNWLVIDCVSGSAKKGVDPIHDVTINNITILDRGKNHSILTGYSGSQYAEGTVNGVYFSNIYMPNSTAPATSLEEMNITEFYGAENILVAETLATDEALTPYLSYQSNGATHSIRLLIGANLKKVASFDNLNVTLTFNDKSGKAVKTFAGKLASEKSDFALYRTVVAGGKLYTASQGGALFGRVITEIPTAAWDSVDLTVKDQAGKTLAAGSLLYSDVASDITITPDGEIPSFDWDTLS